MPQRKATTKKKTDLLVETSESISRQTTAFLENGGVVEVVQRGVSGQESTTGKKNISYSKKS